MIEIEDGFEKPKNEEGSRQDIGMAGWKGEGQKNPSREHVLVRVYSPVKRS